MAQDDPRELYLTIADNLKTLRRSYQGGQGISQLKLAKALGISQQTYASYETATTRLPIEMLDRIASFFDVPMSSILHKADSAAARLRDLSEESFTAEELAEIENYVQFVKLKRKQ